ncbi:hypothetical protein RCH18_001601 [Flavobacterium sp. PL11]|uniref:hypothetical protein n=1 Tax=Flavobacterium sp. PL11 TaxID=3071717 RepID=UPI002E069AEA|nr:hypothetical protein [Flavobacterium sp. PL11]
MSKAILLFFSLFFFTSTTVVSQKLATEEPQLAIPLSVTTDFNLKFPSQEPNWVSSYEGRYNQKLVHEARFIFDNRNSSAIYDNVGDLIAFAAVVERSEIPVEALNYMKEKYPNYSILDTIIVTRGKSDISYELGILVNGQYIIKVFSNKGKFIKSTRA